jgi:hypothetical protein
MAKISYETCVSRFSIQVQELARMENFYNRLDELYQDSIGKLYDEFSIKRQLAFILSTCRRMQLPVDLLLLRDT